jgi:hypothetical protein
VYLQRRSAAEEHRRSSFSNWEVNLQKATAEFLNKYPNEIITMNGAGRTSLDQDGGRRNK